MATGGSPRQTTGSYIVYFFRMDTGFFFTLYVCWSFLSILVLSRRMSSRVHYTVFYIHATMRRNYFLSVSVSGVIKNLLTVFYERFCEDQ